MSEAEAANAVAVVTAIKKGTLRRAPAKKTTRKTAKSTAKSEAKAKSDEPPAEASEPAADADKQAAEPEPAPAPEAAAFDVFAATEVRRTVDSLMPDVIIHTAAMSDIGDCAADPEGSYRANVTLPLWLVKTGVKCVLYSTDQVYSGFGEGGPFREDEVSPANLYAEEKLEMERRALEINPDTVLLRATWMYDMPRYGTPNRGNFLMNMFRANGGEIALTSSEMRGIT